LWLQEGVRRADELVHLERPGGRGWRIYDISGRQLARAELPAGFTAVEWRGDRLIGVVRDELGQQWVVVLQLRTSADG
jgi:hypothetical protein